MDWFKVEARIGSNEKVDELSDGAFRALIHVWAHAMAHENGGRVPANAARLIPRVNAKRLAELEAAGFIHRNGGPGWDIHDWDEHQAEALAAHEKRKADIERKREHRAKEAERLREYRSRKSREEP